MTISDKTRAKWKDKIDCIIQSYEMCCIDLNDWERGFIESVEMQIEGGKDLSMKQSKCLNRIYEKC